MKESLKTTVIVENKDKELEIEWDIGVLTFRIEGQKLFLADFNGNLEEVFAQALKRWSYKYEVKEVEERI